MSTPPGPAGPDDEGLQARLRQHWAQLNGEHFPVPQRKELSADMVAAAARLVVHTGFGSTSMLQRRLQITFSLAGQLMDELERYEIVGPHPGTAQARPVLCGWEQADTVFAQLTGIWRPRGEQQR